ncbi:MAG: hypothetical protein D3914_15790 [Candidatus Electrothrix sp. LOE2]|nr:hypothetical protein [Candidatus Electrothrix sp. LOE2]
MVRNLGHEVKRFTTANFDFIRAYRPATNVVHRPTLEKMVGGPDVSLDKRFVYYLPGSSGVCVVPLSSFATKMQGFRITLPERLRIIRLQPAFRRMLA